MKITGIIAEYNPFHNGHAYHIKKSKELTNSDGIVVVMSGDYTQRGEPAITSKYNRTKMALLNGADLVIELPAMFATSSAEHFAYAAIYLLNQTGIIESVCFGSEEEDIQKLNLTASLLLEESAEFKQTLKQQLKTGISYASARGLALSVAQGASGINPISQPNSILAVEYIKAINRINSNIQPVALKRLGAAYNSEKIEGYFASATAVRKAIKNGIWESAEKSMPGSSASILKNSNLTYLDDFSLLFHSAISGKHKSGLHEIFDISEGLHNRIIRAAYSFYNISDIVSAVKTKRYAHSKIQRDIIHTILNLTKKDFLSYKGKPEYIRVLGFKKEKAYILKKMASHALLPVVINLKKQSSALSQSNQPAWDMLQFDIMASELYNAASKSPKNEFSQSLVII